MALYLKKTLTEASPYVAGMEDGWTLLWPGGLFTHEKRKTREDAQAYFDSMFRDPDVPHTGEAEPKVVPVIHTLEGLHAIGDGDWIATGPKGERYPIKPDIFEATYVSAPVQSEAEQQAFTDDDWFTIEAADQVGFQHINDDANVYVCTQSQIVAFAKMCMRAGMYQARKMDNPEAVDARIAAIDAEMGSIVEAERVRYLTSRGYMRDEAGKWVKPAELLCDDEGCPHHGTEHVCVSREPCEYCGPGKSTGMPGNACENCMNTGLKNPTAEDLK